MTISVNKATKVDMDVINSTASKNRWTGDVIDGIPRDGHWYRVTLEGTKSAGNVRSAMYSAMKRRELNGRVRVQGGTSTQIDTFYVQIDA